MLKILLATTTIAAVMASMPDPVTIYAFKVPGLTGGIIDFSRFKGQKILIVNTASLCGNTPQYADLEKLYHMYQGKLVIVGFPANNFGQQEPGTNAEIAAFCHNKYHITFPMAAKISVKGPDTHPLYRWLANQCRAKGLEPAEPQWNFQKYLIDEKGQLVAVFAPSIHPLDPQIIHAITKTYAE
ncbi:MAG: glutathione peroxidase [Thermoflavifilum sp.]|nr:glutathione peroxidase [Thermoflavifilum sp.]